MTDLPHPVIFLGSIGAALFLLVVFIVAVIKAFTQKTKGWIITAVLCLVLGVAGLGAIAGQVLSLVGEMAAKAKRIEKTLESKNRRYAVKVPNAWSEMPALNAEADVGAGNLLMEQYFLMLVEQKADLDINLEQFSELSAQQTTDRLKDGKMEEAQPLQIGSLKAIQRRISGTADGVQVVFLHTSLETDVSLLQLLCWTLPSKEKTAVPVFQQMLQTFEIKNEVKPARAEKVDTATEPTP